MPGPFDFISDLVGGSSAEPAGARRSHYTSGGIFDALLGPPANIRQQREQQAFKESQDASARGREELALSNQQKAMQSIARMRIDNPQMGGQQLLQQWLTSEEGSTFLKNNPRGIDQKFISDVVTSMTNPFEKVGATERLVEIVPGAEGDAPEARELLPAAPKPQSIIVEGGTPEAEEFSLGALKPGSQVVVDFLPDPGTGRRIAVDVKSLGGQNITIENKTEAAGAAEYGKGLTKRSLDEVKARERLYTTSAMAQRLFSLFGDDPNKAQTRYGALGIMAQLSESAVTQASAIAQEFNLTAGQRGLKPLPIPGEERDDSTWSKLYESFPLLKEAAPGARVRANVTALVYMLAKTVADQEGRDLSNADVDRMYEMIGARWGSVPQLRAGIHEVLSGAWRGAYYRWQAGRPLYEALPKDSMIRDPGDPYLSGREQGFQEFFPADSAEPTTEEGLATPRAAPAPAGAATQKGVTPADVAKMTKAQIRALDPDTLDEPTLEAAIKKLKGGK